MGRRRMRSTHIPAGIPTSSTAENWMAANTPIAAGVAPSTSTAVSGSPSRVIREPISDTACPPHNFRKSGLRHSPPNRSGFLLQSTSLMKKNLVGEMLAEFLGTMVLILFGTGVVAMVVLFGHGLPAEVVNGGYTNITLGWGLAVTMGIYIAGKTSGAHLNPAVTITLAAFRGFPWSKVIPYSIVQIAGAFAAAALVFWNYHPAFLRADPQLDHTAGVFTTFPAFPDLLSEIGRASCRERV